MAMKTLKALYKFTKIIDYLYFQVGPPLGDVSTQRRKKMKIRIENENEKKRIQKKERIKDILVIALKKLTLSDTNIRRLILKTSKLLTTVLIVTIVKVTIDMSLIISEKDTRSRLASASMVIAVLRDFLDILVSIG